MIQIIPAIDIIEGKCVRLSQGDYAQKKVYNEQPLEVAKQFEDHGITRLHLVDLDGAKSNRIINYKVLETIARNTNLVIDFGGGLKSNEDLRIAFNSGAAMITGGSIAVKNPELFTQWISTYGAEKIILGADVQNNMIAISGWQESTQLPLFDFLQSYREKGVLQTICTDISKDGMLQGPATELYKRIKAQFSDLYVVASGGVAHMSDIEELNAEGIDAVITGKAIYEGTISLKQIAQLIEN
ncbi:MAG: 1-(5-phosphoribosyl)-5-[(5-phosphoribosylamino)methylideneamino]imidazole-4-carboxamide isomerase [Bacteroidales bacterium]|jgi:phosphoribosylformimino-5-aminoimidazole carboxamide ribotide isomerase|nr:1-(5-phosphoribosyl)-5-[(5-phosphoribosylamino)methylideneamino]imidazole-4-carboxamide isomerase [Bacteroidales bacterium]